MVCELKLVSILKAVTLNHNVRLHLVGAGSGGRYTQQRCQMYCCLCSKPRIIIRVLILQGNTTYKAV